MAWRFGQFEGAMNPQLHTATYAACVASLAIITTLSVVALQAAHAVAADSASARSRSVPARWGGYRVASRRPLRVQLSLDDARRRRACTGQPLLQGLMRRPDATRMRCRCCSAACGCKTPRRAAGGSHCCPMCCKNSTASEFGLEGLNSVDLGESAGVNLRRGRETAGEPCSDGSQGCAEVSAI